jgi:hypothetical protein
MGSLDVALPAKVVGGTEPRDALAKLGITLGHGLHDTRLLRITLLPEGWVPHANPLQKGQRCIVDQHQRWRLSTQDLASRDRDRPPILKLETRYRILISDVHDNQFDGYVVDYGKMAYNANPLEYCEYCASRKFNGAAEYNRAYRTLHEELVEFLDTFYPDWRDPLAYWD